MDNHKRNVLALSNAAMGPGAPFAKGLSETEGVSRPATPVGGPRPLHFSV